MRADLNLYAMKNWTLEDFKKIFSDWKQSGLTMRAYCQNIGIREDRFYLWHKRLKRSQQLPSRSSGFMPVNLSSRQNGRIDVRCAQAKQSSSADSLCELVYPNGVTLRITSDMTLEQLRAMVMLLNS